MSTVRGATRMDPRRATGGTSASLYDRIARRADADPLAFLQMSIEIPNTPNPRLKTHTPEESRQHLRLEAYEPRSTRSNSNDSQEEAQRCAAEPS